ncbi:MAG: glycosyltransferase [Actinomycetota bacterium]|nr:glycosyltransferase [Actinomycetota bacterium]
MADSHLLPADRNGRPPVSVVVPFRGGQEAAGQLSLALERLRTRSGDELLIVSNNEADVVGDLLSGVCEVVPARDHASSYYARNVGAERAKNEWILFMDADCEPASDVLDAYFEAPVKREHGALAGEIEPAGRGLLARWADSRGLLRQAVNLNHPYRPSAVTANLLVRSEAWRAIGGFQEGIRSGGDGDFCWRMQAAGWELGRRPSARVRHAHRERLRPLAGQLARHAAGASWLNRRYPGSSPRPRLLRDLFRDLAGAIVWLFSARFESAVFKAVDAVAATSTAWGYNLSNFSPRQVPPRSAPDVTLVFGSFPSKQEAVQMARSLSTGSDTRVVAFGRPKQPVIGGLRGLHVEFREDAAMFRRASCLARLVVRHPVRCLRDLYLRRGGDSGTASLAAMAVSAQGISTRGRIDDRLGDASPAEAARLLNLLGVKQGGSTKR